MSAAPYGRHDSCHDGSPRSRDGGGARALVHRGGRAASGRRLPVPARVHARRRCRRGSRRRDLRARAARLGPIRPVTLVRAYLALHDRAHDRAVSEPEHHVETPELGLSPALERALAALSAADREVVALRVVLELDAESTARLLDISATACTTRLSRA